MKESTDKFGGLYSSITYEYKCTGCNGNLEIRRSMDQRDDELQCPDCGDAMLRKFSTFGFKI